jgi:drug/metabolite transporter (DMT)-like permease
MNSRNQALFYVLLISLFGGSIGVVNKLGVQHLPPLSFVTSRVLVALLIISPFYYRSVLQLRHTFLKLMPFSLLATGNITFFILGISHTTATLAGVMYSATPLLTALFSFFFYKRKISLHQSLGLIVGFVGTILIIITPLLSNPDPLVGSLFGNLLIAIAVVNFSLHLTLSQKIQEKFTPLNITLAFIVTASLILAPIGLWQLQQQPDWLSLFNPKSLFLIFYVALIGTWGLYFSQQKAISYANPLIASLSMYLGPFISTILAVVILSERITPSFVVGALLAFLGVYLVTAKRHTQEITKRWSSPMKSWHPLK